MPRPIKLTYNEAKVVKQISIVCPHQENATLKIIDLPTFRLIPCIIDKMVKTWQSIMHNHKSQWVPTFYLVTILLCSGFEIILCFRVYLVTSLYLGAKCIVYANVLWRYNSHEISTSINFANKLSFFQTNYV